METRASPQPTVPRPKMTAQSIRHARKDESCWQDRQQTHTCGLGTEKEVLTRPRLDKISSLRTLLRVVLWSWGYVLIAGLLESHPGTSEVRSWILNQDCKESEQTGKFRYQTCAHTVLLR